MKKIIILLFVTLLLTSCFGKNNKNLSKNEKTIQIEKTFKHPENDLELLIDKLESLDRNDYSVKLDLAKAYLKYGNDYFQEDIFADKSLEILNTLPEKFIIDYLKGYAYEIKRNYNEALKYYDKALSYDNLTNEQKARAINQKGHVYDLMGKMEEANKYYLEAEKINPEGEKILLNRGRYELRKWNYKKAEKYFKKVLEKTNDNTLKSELYYDLSLIYKDLYELDKAIESAELGIQYNKDYPNNYLALGVLYITKGGEDLDKALDYLKKSIELYPNNSVAYKYLGIYYYKKDNFDKAIENFKKQVELSSKDILLMANDKEKVKISGEYDLARTYALKGDVKNSVKYLKKVLNGKNDIYYEWFLIDYVNNKGDFHKIINDDFFKEELKKITILYAKKLKGEKE